jgi:hypothetical protein
MSDESGTLRIAVGDGGWLHVRAATPAGTVMGFVQLVQDDDGRLYTAVATVQPWQVKGGRTVPLRGAHLRAFPLAAIEAEANGPLRDEVLAGIDGDVHLTLSGEGRKPGEPRKRRTPAPETDLTLELPATKPYPDDFYRAVARRYIDAFRFGGARPAALIAEANDVPLKTVHRWVAEARKRGMLPPGRRGKAG